VIWSVVLFLEQELEHVIFLCDFFTQEDILSADNGTVKLHQLSE
jgi:hypothetical protein